MSSSNGTRIDIRVAQYLVLRKELAEKKAAYEAEIAPLLVLKQKLDGSMMQFLDQTGQQSAKTAEGTVYTFINPTAVCTDPDAFVDFVRKNDAYELMDRKANATACNEYAEEHDGVLPPGVRINRERKIGVKS